MRFISHVNVQELSTANKCLSQGADESRVLLTVREQGLEALDGKPAADVVASRELLSAVDRARELNKGEAKVLIAAPESDAEEAAAATREARERHAAESGKDAMTDVLLLPILEDLSYHDIFFSTRNTGREQKGDSLFMNILEKWGGRIWARF